MSRIAVAAAPWPTRVVLAALLVAPTVRAAERPLPKTGLDEDAVLAELVRAALAQRPEIAQARARLAASEQRVPQAGALPDPTLSVGIQNDGFDAIRVGEMETSWYLVMLSQPLPFPGKLGLRRDVTALEARAGAADVARIELSTTADVRRAYVDLLLARDNTGLQERLVELWQQAERVARARYEVGEGSQADLLRAQLERTRLTQQRLALVAAERVARQRLNRLRGGPLDAPIETPRGLREIAPPELPPLVDARQDAFERSPELARAGFATTGAERRVDLADRELWPDFGLRAGIMPRGKLLPMWQLTVDLSLPVYAASKQLRAADEARAQLGAERAGAETVRQLLALRTEERLAQLEAVLAANALYRGGLLVQSEATVDSTVAQYQVGKVPLVAVLEALRGYFDDQASYLASLAQSFQLAIAQQELSLEGAAALGVVSGGAAMGTGGGAETTAAPAPAPSAPAGGAATSGMGGM